MDIETISYKTNELTTFDGALLEKLHDSGFVNVESLVYRSYNYLSSQLRDVLEEEELNTVLYSLTTHLTLMRIRGVNESLAKAIVDNYMPITSVPYANEEHLQSILSDAQADISLEDTLKIQRNAAIFLKSGKMVVNCLEASGNNLTDVELSIPYPTEEDANKFYTFFPNDEGDIFLENIEYGMHDAYIKHDGNTYKKSLTILPENIYRYRFELHDSIRIELVNEFLDGESTLILPEVSYVMTQDEIQDGESFKIFRISDDKVSLLADHRIQDGSTWLIRNITIAKSNFDFEYELGDRVIAQGDTWIKENVE